MYDSTTIVGNVGRDPEMRYAPSGDAVTSFSLATNKSYTNKAGDKVKTTKWFRVTVWGKRAETVAQWVHKGDTVLVEGELIADADTGGPKIFKKNNGMAGCNFEITANNVRFIKLKNNEGGDTNEDSEGGGVPFDGGGSNSREEEPF